MAVLVAVLAFVVGVGFGVALAMWWLRRAAIASPSLDAVPAAKPAGEPMASADDPDGELKPILDATRGVLTDLEERYRGRRSGKSDA